MVTILISPTLLFHKLYTAKLSSILYIYEDGTPLRIISGFAANEKGKYSFE